MPAGPASSSTATTSPTRSWPRPPRRTPGWWSWTSRARSSAASQAGVQRVLLRVTPGIEADTHVAIQTGHVGSKFGVPPEDALGVIAAARQAGLEMLGLHVHIGSQLMDERRPASRSTGWPASPPRRGRSSAGRRRSSTSAAVSASATSLDEPAPPSPEEYARTLSERVYHAWEVLGLPRPRLIFEPGRVARRPRRHHPLPGRRRQARGRHDLGRGRRRDERQPAPGPVRRALLGAAREPRGRGADGRVRRLRQALRVRRRPDRAGGVAGATARRPARDPGDGRVHAGDGARRTTPSRSRRPCSPSPARRGSSGAGDRSTISSTSRPRASEDKRRPGRGRMAASGGEDESPCTDGVTSAAETTLAARRRRRAPVRLLLRAREWLRGTPTGLVVLALAVGAGAGGGAVGFRYLILGFTKLFTGYDDYSGQRPRAVRLLPRDRILVRRRSRRSPAG